jgi:hypothetical protein
MKKLIHILALGVTSLLTSLPSYAVYIGDGLYEVKFKKQDRFVGESVKAYLYRKAFESCSEEQLGFKVVELNVSNKPDITFRCEGVLDKKLAGELKIRRELTSDRSEAEPVDSSE